MSERVNGSERSCGDCAECVLHYKVQLNSVPDPRCVNYVCVWRQDSEEAATKDEHRPDLSGVILTSKNNPFIESGGLQTNDELLIHFTRKPSRKVKRWVGWIVETCQVAIRIKVVDHKGNGRYLPKGPAVSRSGVQAFFRRFSKQRGGI